MKATPTEIPGLLILTPNIFEDARGIFVKTYHAEQFRQLGLAFEPKEEFYSVSKKGVLRGMHFQLPGAAHDKLVFPVTGSALDVVLDLRKASPCYGRHFVRQLDAPRRELLFIPAGCAHGFLSLADDTVMVYQTSTVHSPAHDCGVLWNSFGCAWPVADPILSSRDRGFVPLSEFQSPF
jgi:dTDP-4-dehydrorhamnose 3,5-epimerase